MLNPSFHQARCRKSKLFIVLLIIFLVYTVFPSIKLVLYAKECLKTVTPQTPRSVQEESLTIPQKSCGFDEEGVRDMTFSSEDLPFGRWDSSIRYKLFDRVIVGDNYGSLSKQYLVCLATQTSLEKILSLVEVSGHWEGPMSVALFAAGDDELNLLLLYLMYIRRCFPRIRENVAFHLALPRDRYPTKVEVEVSLLQYLSCKHPESVLADLVGRRSTATGKWRIKHAYPQNHLRNLARKNCQTKYVFLTDVDVVPSYGAAAGLDKFLRTVTCKSMCAYVIPVYEVDKRVPFPQNKSEIVRLANKGLARPFHEKVFIFNQYATNFTAWQSVRVESQDIHVSHWVTNYEFFYEPFYVATDDVPPHDERFVGYGFTRNTQVYEMYIAGYEFLVLSPIFACHWGLQPKRGKPAWRDQQNLANGQLFKTFKLEIFAKYGYKGAD